MKRSGAAKFPNSVQLFKFCQKVMTTQKGGKINDQEVGSILSYNPSDCSHWKRGEKNVRSVFSLAKLAEALQVEGSLVHDVASGACGLDEAFYEWQESNSYKASIAALVNVSADRIQAARDRVSAFVEALLAQAEFTTAPLYLPEIMRLFSFISFQPTDMMDKLSRILRVKQGQYVIHFKKGDLKAQTRLSTAKDLARIICEGERERFPELGTLDPELVDFEKNLFVASLMTPRHMLIQEMSRLDSRRNIIAELAAAFWVPKSLVCFQLQDMVRCGVRLIDPTHMVVTSSTTDTTLNQAG